jgi:dienelactone hydrolase
MTFANSLGCALLAGLLCLAREGVVLAQQTPSTSDFAGQVVYLIKPSQTDPATQLFDEPHLVVFHPALSADAPLVVFMPGTGGEPTNYTRLLRVVASRGYRALGLEYEDEPAVLEVCSRDPRPSCSGNFRHRRIFGEGTTLFVKTPPAESIVNRLVKLLEYLDRQHPGNGWNSYLAAGRPDWGRIVVSGLSQGAGMAAYIAKRESVARVVLFSSPWDFVGRDRTLAPWLSEPSATPPERWFAEYHEREITAALIARAYRVLRIPPENIRVFGLPIPPGLHFGHTNEFHVSTVKLPAYEAQWRFLFGEPR